MLSKRAAFKIKHGFSKPRGKGRLARQVSKHQGHQGTSSASQQLLVPKIRPGQLLVTSSASQQASAQAQPASIGTSSASQGSIGTSSASQDTSMQARIVAFKEGPSILQEQHQHMLAIDALAIDPLLKHWQVIPTKIRMPASYHPDRGIRRECLAYAFNQVRDFMDENNCGWTEEAFQKARDAASEFKKVFVPLLFPEWKDSAQTY